MVVPLTGNPGLVSLLLLHLKTLFHGGLDKSEGVSRRPRCAHDNFHGLKGCLGVFTLPSFEFINDHFHDLPVAHHFLRIVCELPGILPVFLNWFPVLLGGTDNLLYGESI